MPDCYTTVDDLPQTQSIFSSLSLLLNRKKYQTIFALKKVHGQNVTASQVRTNTQILQNLISQDQAYLFPRQIPGSPPYWQKFMYEVVAMVKQLGIPTWFMTLSCADLRWPGLNYFRLLLELMAKTLLLRK